MNRSRRVGSARFRGVTALLACTLGGLAVSPFAVAEVAFYGRAHLAVSYLNDGNDYSAFNLSSNSSRIGLRAGHTVTRDLEVLAQMEGDVEFDIGGDDGFEINSRNTFAGLRGEWGLVRLGRFDTPVKRLKNNVSLFRDQVGDSRNIARYSETGVVRFDERFRNALAYTSPVVHPFVFDLAYSFDTEEGTAADDNNNDAVSATLTYRMGAAYAGVGHERWNFEDSDQERDVTRASAYHDWGDLRGTVFYQRASDPDDRVYGVGTRYALSGELSVKLEYYVLRAEENEADAEQVAIGADFQASPELMLYVTGAWLGNDEDRARSPWNQGISLDRAPDGASLEDNNAWALSVGTVYRF